MTKFLYIKYFCHFCHRICHFCHFLVSLSSLFFIMLHLPHNLTKKWYTCLHTFPHLQHTGYLIVIFILLYMKKIIYTFLRNLYQKRWQNDKMTMTKWFWASPIYWKIYFLKIFLKIETFSNFLSFLSFLSFCHILTL